MSKEKARRKLIMKGQGTCREEGEGERREEKES